MIPGAHRTKGGAPLLGAERPGQPGPFGARTGDLDPDASDPEDTSTADRGEAR
ncbi:hypothetical protein [Streptomyces sp. NPDC059533]|uniref:hypothetical protein n=1 Tax=unclassified Streptomyces TaxID=2593676 RepID=UPI00369CE43D